MYSLTIDNFLTEDEAVQFMNWMLKVGEQDLSYWLEERAQEGENVRDFIAFETTDFKIRKN